MLLKNLCVAAVLVSILSSPTMAGQVGKWLNRQSIRNSSGQKATDLRVHLEQSGDTSVTPKVEGFPSATLTGDGSTILANGGELEFGESTFVTWGSTVSMNRIAGGTWSRAGTDVGQLEFTDVKLLISDIADGYVRVSIDNQSGPLNYANLGIAAGVDDQFFTLDSFLEGVLVSGTPVNLLVPASGTLLPGVTNVAEYLPARSGAYNVGSVEIEGAFFAEGVLVPEPATNMHGVIAVGLLLVGAQERRRRSSVTSAMLCTTNF